MNNVSLSGRLTKKPEIHLTKGEKPKAVCTAVLAVRRPTTKKQSDFIVVVFWNKDAEIVAKYLDKGSLIEVKGMLQSRSYEDKDGNRKFITEVVVERWAFLEYRKAAAPETEDPNTEESPF